MGYANPKQSKMKDINQSKNKVGFVGNGIEDASNKGNKLSKHSLPGASDNALYCVESKSGKLVSPTIKGAEDTRLYTGK